MRLPPTARRRMTVTVRVRLGLGLLRLHARLPTEVTPPARPVPLHIASLPDVSSHMASYSLLTHHLKWKY